VWVWLGISEIAGDGEGGEARKVRGIAGYEEGYSVVGVTGGERPRGEGLDGAEDRGCEL
jgi:hypothetical protein